MLDASLRRVLFHLKYRQVKINCLAGALSRIASTGQTVGEKYANIPCYTDPSAGDGDSDSKLDSDSDRVLQTLPPDSGFMRDHSAPMTSITVQEFVHAHFLDPFLTEIDHGRPIAFKDVPTSGVLMRHLYEAPQVVVPFALQQSLLKRAHRRSASGIPEAQAVILRRVT